MATTSAKTRILLVEDNPDAVLLVRMLLGARDPGDSGDARVPSLAHADCLAAGLELLSWNVFDLILLNPFLPDSDGVASVVRIGESTRLPILVLTDRDDPALAVQALEAGADDVLFLDEIDKKALRRSVRSAVARCQARQKLVAAKEEAERLSRDQIKVLDYLGDEAARILHLILAASDRLERQEGQLLDQIGGAASLADIRHNAHNLQAMAEDLRDLSRLQGQRLHLDEQKCDLAALAHDAVVACKGRAQANGLILALDIAPALPKVLVDPARLRQALDRVLDNALKFTPPGGRIGVRVAATLSGGTEIIISDSGVGFANQDKALLVKPFGRVERGGRRPGEGPGLGLALAAALMQGHGGRLGLASTSSGGASVTLSLPDIRTQAQATGQYPVEAG